MGYITKDEFGEVPQLINFGKYIAGEFVQPKWEEVPDKIAIVCAVTGAFISKEENPSQPYTVEEIRREVSEAIEAGACSVHVHVRDERGISVSDPELFHRVLDPVVKAHPDIVLDCAMHYGKSVENSLEFAESGIVEISPVRVGATYSGDEAVVVPPQFSQGYARFLERNGMKPQLAVFYPGQIDLVERYLIKPKVVSPPYFWIILPGLPGGSMANPLAMMEELLIYVRRIQEIDPVSPWIVCVSGRASSYLGVAAALLGGHVRVGMEDDIFPFPHQDDKIKHNRDEVRRMIEVCRLLGREPMSPDEYRAMIGLPLSRFVNGKRTPIPT